MKNLRMLAIALGHWCALTFACTSTIALITEDEVNLIRAAKAGGDRVQFEYQVDDQTRVLKAGVPSGISWGNDGALAGFNLAPTESSSEPIDAKRIVSGTVTNEVTSRGPSIARIQEDRVMRLRASRKLNEPITLKTTVGEITGIVQNLDFGSDDVPTTVTILEDNFAKQIPYESILWD